MALVRKMHWTELLRQDHLSLSPHVYQCLVNNVCLKEHLRTEHHFSRIRPVTWLIHSPGAPSPKGWTTGPLCPGRPMGFASLVQMKCCLWLLRQSAGEHSSLYNLIAFQTVWCPSEHSISSSCSLHTITSSNPLPAGGSTTQFDLGSMLLHIKRYLSAQFSFFLVWNQPSLPRLCSPQVVWPWAEPGTTWYSRFQVCTIIVLSALLPSQSSMNVKWELWGKGLVNWQSVEKC